MRKTYFEPEVELLCFDGKDILTTSGGDPDPGVPGDNGSGGFGGWE